MVGTDGRFLIVASLVAVLTLGVAGTAVAERGERISCIVSAGDGSGGCPEFPRLQFQLGGEVGPMTLSRSQMQPAALDLRGRVSTTDGTHPPALREMTLELDRNIAIGLRGVPVCRPAPAQDIRRPPGELGQRCKDSIVGGGKADMEIAFPEQQPIQEQSPLTVYNAGFRDGAQTLHVYAYVTVPVPAAIVSTVEIKRAHEGRFGSQAVVKVPVIAGGSGSLLDFNLRIKRLLELGGVRKSVVKARCPDGHLDVAANSVLFKNEAKTPGAPAATALKGSISIPCAPTR